MKDISDEELPDLATLLTLPASSAGVRRQSPRKGKQSSSPSLTKNFTSDVSIFTRQTRASPRKLIQGKPSQVETTSTAKLPAISLSNVQVLPRYGSKIEASASSNNGLARSPQQRSIGLTHVDSLLLPLSKVCLDAEARPKQLDHGSRGVATSNSTRPEAMKRLKQADTNRPDKAASAASKFVLSEAASADDFENSLIDEDEDEDTDLSGFVVDDNVELSIHESSTDSEIDQRAKRKPSAPPRRRRLQQGARPRRRDEILSHEPQSDRPREPNDAPSDIFRDLKIGSKDSDRPTERIEIVDLTSSSPRTRGDTIPVSSNTGGLFNGSTQFKRHANHSDLFNDFDATFKFSPPNTRAPVVVPTKAKTVKAHLLDESNDGAYIGNMHTRDGFTTPPATPSRSPSKLKSPSKLPSPSKRAAQVLHSPHRQSLDGFWDLEVVNSWNDTYSPKKAPVTSPQKNRFLDLLNSGNEDDETPTGLLNDSSDSLPSPCSSPRKSRSPERNPDKVEKQRLLEVKRAAKVKKQEFDSKKEHLANALVADLDDHITSSNLSALSSGTGGVQIMWSKTLRSTAGRANWRRTVIKPTESPVKSSSVLEGSRVQHYASIELASKVIDCESRLVNTLAHEFCHLANFMVSNVRDQPHGQSFKAWAVKVTKYLRAHENPIYHSVEVTTKHSYTIDHKYLWVCAGREALDFFKDVPEAEDGCGAEYGRHSKSIDTDKHRCGRCKGALIQVRPRPRKVDPKRSSPRKALFQKKTPVETVTEAVEIVDLTD